MKLVSVTEAAADLGSERGPRPAAMFTEGRIEGAMKVRRGNDVIPAPPRYINRLPTGRPRQA